MKKSKIDGAINDLESKGILPSGLAQEISMEINKDLEKSIDSNIKEINKNFKKINTNISKEKLELEIKNYFDRKFSLTSFTPL